MRNDLAAWQQQVTAAAGADDAFETVLSAVSQDSAKPAVVVVGDFSAGKSSFIKRLLVEMDGAPTESIGIRADPTTDEVRRYPLSGFDVVDTPGFQSGRAEHDDRALACVREAALVVVLFHVNLLIGDTTWLEEITKGTTVAVGKWPRVLFLVNRCDVLGVDPVDAPAEYFNRSDRKQAELVAALRSRDIDVASSHVHGIASDPFAGVGQRWPVARSDYGTNRDWDGMAALVDALRSLTESQLAQAGDWVTLDDAFTHLLHLRSRTSAEIEAYRAEDRKHDSLLRALAICLEDAEHLRRSLEQELSQRVARYTFRAIEQIRSVRRGDEQALVAAIETWADKDARDEVQRFMTSAAEEINDWAATHASALNREFANAMFDGGLSFSIPPSAADTAEDVAEAAGFVADAAQKFAAVLGNRDAALKIGHFFGHKFKPWGAIKAGRAVAKVGVVLQAAAVAFDAASWVQEVRRKANWQQKCDDAVAQVEAMSAETVQKLLYEDDGPQAVLVARQQEVRTIHDDCQARHAAVQAFAEKLETRLEVTDRLLAASCELRKVGCDD